MTYVQRTKNDTLTIKVSLEVDFYRSDSGREPARDWLRSFDEDSRKRLGEDIRRLQMAWPVGMPLVRKLGKELWELRTRLANGIARVFFTVYDRKIVLLHGMTKKSQALPLRELNVARARLLDFKIRIKQ